MEPALHLEWAFAHVGRIEGVGAPTLEVPMPVPALVAVVIDQGHDDPQVADLVLGSAVQRTRGMVVVDEIDDVVAQEVKGRPVGTQDRVEPLGQGFAPGPCPSCTSTSGTKSDTNVATSRPSRASV